ncbi:hypothetical protein ABVT39_011031 [Epinephelus coioides]
MRSCSADKQAGAGEPDTHRPPLTAGPGQPHTGSWIWFCPGFDSRIRSSRRRISPHPPILLLPSSSSSTSSSSSSSAAAENRRRTRTRTAGFQERSWTIRDLVFWVFVEPVRPARAAGLLCTGRPAGTVGFLDQDVLCRNKIPDEDSQKAEKERTVRQVGLIRPRSGPDLRDQWVCECVPQ